MSEKKWYQRQLFFGWSNLKWMLRELNKMGSESEKSFYSYKRFQTFAAFRVFIIGWTMVLMHLLEIKADVYEFLAWASPLLLVAGHTLILTERAKKNEQGNVEKDPKDDV